jgi:hypothetical protein
MIELAVSYVDPSAPSGVLPPSLALPIALATDLAASAGGTHLLAIGPGISIGGCEETAVTLEADDLGEGGATTPHALEPATSAAYTSETTVVVLHRAPLSLVRYAAGVPPQTLVLDRAPLPDGARLFDSVTPSGLACSSCHPEGGDDGHHWAFGEGPDVRTPSLRGGILSTAPFHWVGDMPTFRDLVHETFRVRMSGNPIGTDESALFAAWVDAIPAPPPVEGEADAIARGRALFESTRTGCATCHVGDEHTNGATVDVGTGLAFQVPHLVGVAYRGPYMHDGCAPTLREVVAGDASCRGELHGTTDRLAASEIDDLVAYLRSL